MRVNQLLCHRPDVLVIDYSLNDREDLAAAHTAWEEMIQKALAAGIKVILCTPTWDCTYYGKNDMWNDLVRHAEQVRALAEQYSVGLADSFAAFERRIRIPSDLTAYLSHWNHPSRAGHELVALEIGKYFPAR